MGSLDNHTGHEEQPILENNQKLQYLFATTDVVDILQDLKEHEVDTNQLLITLAKSGSISEIFELVDFISVSKKTELLRLLVERADKKIIDEILRNVDKFLYPENREAIFELFLSYAPNVIFFHIEKFKDINNDKLGEALVNANQYKLITMNIALFPNIDRNELANKLMLSIGGLIDLSYKIKEFPSIDKYLLLEKLIESDLSSAVFRSIEEIVDINNSEKCANLLIKSGLSTVIVKFISLFPNVNLDEIYSHLKNEEKIAVILSNHQLFPNINWDELFEILIQENTDRSLMLIGQYIEHFPNLNLIELARSIINKVGSRFVDANILFFAKQGVNELAEVLFSSGAGFIIAKHLDVFKSVDMKRLANALIKERAFWLIICNINKFPFINRSELIAKLIKNDQAYLIFQNIKLFSNFDRHKLLQMLVQRGSFEDVLENHKIFPNLDFRKILFLLAAQKDKLLIEKYLSLFVKNNQIETIEILTENGYLDLIAEHIDEFSNLDVEKYLQKVIEVGKFYIITALAHKFKNIKLENVLKQVVRYKQEFANS